MTRDYRIIQISDVHLRSDDARFAGSLPRDNLLAAVGQLVDADLAPDLLLLTGDLADAGDPACYRDLSETMEDAALRLGSRILYLPGNHDDRAALRRTLLGRPPSPAPINQVHWIGGLRLVLLDSVVPGQEHGELGGGTLDFLRDALGTPAPDGTVLALHHPPIPSPVEPMARINLRRPESLAAVVEGSDVRLVLCGHDHHAALGRLGSVPVWVSPATAYEMDVLSRDAVRALPGCSVSQIDLVGDEVTVVPLRIPLGRS